MNITTYTPFIHLETGAYPKHLDDVRKENPTKSFAEFPTEDTLAMLGYAVVHPTERPAGDVIEEKAPELKLGRWVQTWFSRDFTVEELVSHFEQIRQTCLANVRELQARSLDKGCTYTFPDNSSGHIQLRDGDRANMSGLRLRALSVKQTGRSETFEFRTYENVTKTGLSADEIIAMTDVVFDKYRVILGVCWSLKDQAESALNVDMLPQIPADLTGFGI